MSIIKYNVTRKAPITNTENHAMPVITYDNLIEAQETHVERALVRNAMIEGDRVDARVFGYFARIHASDLRHFGYKGCDLWDFVLDESEYPLDDLVYDADLDDPNPGRTIDDMFRQYGTGWDSEV